MRADFEEVVDGWQEVGQSELERGQGAGYSPDVEVRMVIEMSKIYDRWGGFPTF